MNTLAKTGTKHVVDSLSGRARFNVLVCHVIKIVDVLVGQMINYVALTRELVPDSDASLGDERVGYEGPEGQPLACTQQRPILVVVVIKTCNSRGSSECSSSDLLARFPGKFLASSAPNTLSMQAEGSAWLKKIETLKAQTLARPRQPAVAAIFLVASSLLEIQIAPRQGDSQTHPCMPVFCS